MCDICRDTGFYYEGLQLYVCKCKVTANLNRRITSYLNKITPTSITCTNAMHSILKNSVANFYDQDKILLYCNNADIKWFLVRYNLVQYLVGNNTIGLSIECCSVYDILSALAGGYYSYRNIYEFVDNNDLFIVDLFEKDFVSEKSLMAFDYFISSVREKSKKCWLLTSLGTSSITNKFGKDITDFILNSYKVVNVDRKVYTAVLGNSSSFVENPVEKDVSVVSERSGNSFYSNTSKPNI